MVWIRRSASGFQKKALVGLIASCYLLIAGNKKARLQPGFLISNELLAVLPDVLVQRLLNHLALHVADNLLLHLAVLEDQQGGDAANSITLRSHRADVDVHLGDLDLALVSSGTFIHDRRQSLAGSAPRRPKIDDHGLFALEDRLVKVAVGDFQNAIACHEFVSCPFFVFAPETLVYPSRTLDEPEHPRFQSWQALGSVGLALKIVQLRATHFRFSPALAQ